MAKLAESQLQLQSSPSVWSVLIAPARVEQVSWPERMVYVDINRMSIRNSPEFDPSAEGAISV